MLFASWLRRAWRRLYAAMWRDKPAQKLLDNADAVIGAATSNWPATELFAV
jgi:hypothetical protein